MSTSIQFRNIVTPSGTIDSMSIRMRDPSSMRNYAKFVRRNVGYALEALQQQVADIQSLEYQLGPDAWKSWSKGEVL